MSYGPNDRLGDHKLDPPDNYDDYEKRCVKFCKAYRTEINDWLEQGRDLHKATEEYGVDSVTDALERAYPTRRNWWEHI